MVDISAPLQKVLEKINSDSFQTLTPDDKGEGVLMLTKQELNSQANSEDFQAIKAKVLEWLGRAKAARSAEERQWYKNLDMAQGRQFTQWNDAEQKMTASPNLSRKPRLAINIIEPIVRTELAKTGSAHPTATVSPASNDDNDIMAALAAEQVWEWFYATSDFQQKVFQPANFWRVHTGQGFWKTFWDSSCVDEAATEAAKRQADQQNAELQSTQDTMNAAVPQTFGAGFGLSGMPAEPPLPLPNPKPIRGKINAIPVSPFNLYFGDLLEEDIQKQPWILHVYMKPIEQVQATYADYLPKDWKPTSTSKETLIDAAHLGMKTGNTAAPDMVQITEAWIKPNTLRLLPDGGLVIIAGETLVGMSEGGLPYDHGEFPFQHITSIDTGRFYRRSVIQSVSPAQNEINRSYAQIIEFKNKVIAPQFFYDAGSLDPKRVTTAAGQFIPVTLGSRMPTPVPLQGLPTFIGDMLDRIKAVVDDISGQHQISRATAPGADTAASALSILQETDDNYQSPTFDSIALAVKSTAKQYLSNAVQLWDMPRFVKVTGDDGSVDAQMLAGSDLVNGTDIKIDDGSALPLSKSARIATVTDWMDKGYITPDIGLKVLEQGMLGKTFKLLKVDEDQAVRENLRMKKMDPAEIQQIQDENAAAVAPPMDPMAAPDDGMPADPFAGINDPAVGLVADDGAAPAAPPVDAGTAQEGMPSDITSMAPPAPPAPVLPINSYDNDAVHIDVHRRHMKSEAYESYDPAVKAVFEEHVAAHVERQNQAMQLGQQLGALPNPGTAPEAGQAEHHAENAAPSQPDGYDASTAPAPGA